MNRRGFLVVLAASSIYPRIAVADADSFAKSIALIEEDNEAFPGASGRSEAKEFSLSTFGAAQPSVGKSKRKVSSRAISLIAAFEVSSRRRYEVKYRRPIWPHGNSGVTIGIGYDLGYVNKTEFEDDWRQYTDSATIKLLEGALGARGARASQILKAFAAADIPYENAFNQFRGEALPKYTALTESVLPNCSGLSDDSLGALVSLTYNRGGSYITRPESDPTGRYKEMQEIRKLMKQEKFGDIPNQIRSMKRIWQGKANVRGLIDRRELEAQLFELGLA